MSELLKLKIKKIRHDVELKEIQPGDVGLDLPLLGLYDVLETEFGLVHRFRTGIAVEPPKGFYCVIRPRSSISKTDWMLANSVGTIDSNYRGEILVPLRFLGPMTHWKKPEKPVVQLILQKEYLFETEIVKHLTETNRGEQGFGSTDR